MSEIPSQLSAALADRYRLDHLLGEGGMATVYLAHDVKHNRKVAVKVLKPELAAVIGAERFLKEIEVTANLQHPHILPLYDSGEAGTLLYYVMPFIEGESLRERIGREKQLAVGDAVRIAGEVAEALQYAHERGVIHRDIKPENILLQNGRPLVADFGIALAVQQAGGSRLTETGLSLGTPTYMSPEQAMGDRDLDARSDVYALSAVLYEMLAGEPPFTGPNAQAIVAKVLASDPEPVTTIRRTVPPAVAEAIRIGLQKLPADRHATAGEFAQALRRLDGPVARPSGTAGSAWRAWAFDLRTLVLTAVAAAATVTAGMMRSGSESIPTRRAILPLDNALDMRAADVALSADGKVLVVGGVYGTGGVGLLVRRMDELDFRVVPRSVDGFLPFLTADGSHVGFFDPEGGLVVQAIDGSDRQRFPDAHGGGTFVDDDRIATFDRTGLILLSRSSGARELLLERPRGMAYQAPFAIAGQTRVIFTSGLAGRGQALLIDVESRTLDTLVPGALSAQHMDKWLFYTEPSGALYAAPMTPNDRGPTGPPVSLGDVAMVNRFGTAALATGRGVIVYGQRQLNRLVRLGADGRRELLLTEPALYHSPRVSPDGRRLVFDRDDGGIGGRDVWVLDIGAGSAPTRVTSVGDGHDPVWTPDGQRVTYLSFLSDDGPIFTVSADGGRGATPLPVPADVGTVNPGTWLPRGSGYIAGLTPERGQADLVILTDSGARPDTIVSSAWDEHSPAISPDGTWLAYVSNETGVEQVYVRRLNGGGGRTIVSDAAGIEPAWHPESGELLYLERHELTARMLAVRIGAGDSPRVLARRVVFDAISLEPVGNHTNWDLTPDGRFIVVEPDRGGRLTMIFDWAPGN